MKTVSLFMALVGLGSLIGVVLFGWHVLSSPDMDASEKILAGLIFVIPFGLLAIVFCAFMGLGAAGLMALKCAKSEPSKHQMRNIQSQMAGLWGLLQKQRNRRADL